MKLPKTLFPPCDDIAVFCERSGYAGKTDSNSSSSGLSYSSTSHSSGSQSRTASHKRGDSSAQEYSDDDSINGDLQDVAEINPNVSSISVAALSSISSTDVVSTSRKDRAPLPKLLAVGRVAGKAEDMIFGTLTPSPTTSRIKEAYMELNGSLPESLGLRTMANSLMAVAKTQTCGHKRKMGWAATKKLRNPVSSTPMLSSDPNCSNCKKSLLWRSSGVACFFCSARVCSKCCAQHVLAIPSSSSNSAQLITMTPVTACTRCFSTVFRNMEAEDVAREEVLAGEYGSVPANYGKPKPARPVSARSLDPSDLQSLSNSGRNQPAYGVKADPVSRLDEQQCDEVVEIDTGDFVRVRCQGAPVQPHAMPFQGSEYLIHSSRSFTGQPSASYGGAPPVVPQSKEDMYTRIAKLNQAAEHVYQFTKRTTDNVTPTRRP
ncbi:hypothetical protein PybrP1_007632 [[Pythium] brassicae (nom. inval.)]|nr:hypothetical protein PybrP1_007632 [[Pythium] brassicae (nom. inval.)]